MHKDTSSSKVPCTNKNYSIMTLSKINIATKYDRILFSDYFIVCLVDLNYGVAVDIRIIESEQVQPCDIHRIGLVRPRVASRCSSRTQTQASLTPEDGHPQHKLQMNYRKTHRCKTWSIEVPKQE